MAIPVLERILITEQDIDEIETLLGDVKFDRPRREIIKDLNSLNVQAFPGSGKTTVLIAKLAILAKKWPYAHKGICVLSHTNVARDEIERRLGQTELGKKLLSYPHFIGTLHSFCDTYIAIPWLRSNGYIISMIDTDIALERRWKKLKYGTRTYLERKKKTEKVCEATSFPVDVEIGCSKTTDTYKDVKRVVEASQQQGYFTFNEMLQSAKYALATHTFLCSAVQNRFPVLLIDEAQDTSEVQWELVASIFNDSLFSIKQTYGDANQAIFQSYGEAKAAKVPFTLRTLTLANSHRFDAAIAKLADCLAVSQHGMTGDATAYAKNQNQHTIFLFDKKRIGNVLQAYARHLLACFSNEDLADASKGGCYIVGMVHSKEPEQPESPHFPVGLRDYWITYNPNAVKTDPKPGHLIDYFRIATHALRHTNDSCSAVESISKAIRRIIQNNSETAMSTTTRAFSSLLNQLSAEAQINFRKEMLEMLDLPISAQAEWCIVVNKFKAILQKYFGISTTTPLSPQWINQDQFSQPADTSISANPPNIFTYHDEHSGRSVDIHFASIHSVKGQTHLATLVVETYWYDFNIKSILPCLYGTVQPKPRSREATRLKCHYVALTRARGLVCVALPKVSVSEHEAMLLRQHGWNIVDV